MITKKYIKFVFIILIACNMKAQNSILLTPSIDKISAYEIKINEIEYSVGVSEYRKKLFIITKDINFKIDKKTIIGRSLSSFKNKDDIKLIKGWAYYLKIDDYWYAAFSRKEELNDDSKVVYVFQYDM